MVHKTKTEEEKEEVNGDKHARTGRREFLLAGGLAIGLGSLADGAPAPAKSKTDTYTLKREIPVDKRYDVVIAGGGPAGVGAAVCAARLGVKVLLIEATGCFGGMGTSGLVTAFDPMGDGTKMLVGGFMREVVETMYSRGFLKPGINPNAWRKNYHNWTPFQVEGYKLVLDEFVTKVGVEVRFFTRVIDAEADPKTGVVSGVVLQNVEGYRFVRGGAYIDATGDGVLADLCGAACREAGRDTEAPMAATLCSLHAGIDWSKWGNQHAALKKALRDKHFTQADRHLPGMSRVSDSVGVLNGGHLFRMNALNRAGVRRVLQEIRFGLRESAVGGHRLGDRRSRIAPDRRRIRVDDKRLPGPPPVPRPDSRVQQGRRYPRIRLHRRGLREVLSGVPQDRAAQARRMFRHPVQHPRTERLAELVGRRAMQFKRRESPRVHPRPTYRFNDGPGRRNRSGTVNPNQTARK